MARYGIGDLITFTYPLKPETYAHDKFPRVLVLHPSYRDVNKYGHGALFVHGLNFNYLTDDEINYLRMMIDPGFGIQYIDKFARKNPNLATKFRRSVTQASNSVMTSPRDFYIRTIKPFISDRGYDPYRLYYPQKMSNVRIVQPYNIISGQQKRGIFGTLGARDQKTKDERDILKDLAKKEAEGRLGQENPQEKRFVKELERTRGAAYRVFQRYKKKFEAARGRKTPGWKRYLPFGRGK